MIDIYSIVNRSKLKLRQAMRVMLSATALLLTSCSGHGSVEPPKTFAIAGVEDPSQDSKPLIGLTVLSERNLAGVMLLELALSSKTALPASSVTITFKLIGASGEMIQISSKKLSELLPSTDGQTKVLQPGSPEKVKVSFELRGATDYQIGVSWKSAAPYSAAQVNTETEEGATAAQIPLAAVRFETDGYSWSNHTCNEYGCGVLATAEGFVINESSTTINQLTLGASFALVGEPWAVPEVANEHRLVLTSLDLQPGEKRHISFSFQQPVAERLKTLVKPVLRVVSE